MKRLILALFVFISLISFAQTPTLVFPKNNQVLADTLIKFQWDEVPGADSYHFQLSTDSLFQSTLLDTNLSNSGFPYLLPLSINPYFFRLQYSQQSTVSVFSKTLKFYCYSPIFEDSCKLWFRADKGIRLSSSGKVMSWKNLINSDTVYQTVESIKPSYINNLGIFPCIKLDSNRYLFGQYNHLSLRNYSVSQFIVFKPLSATSGVTLAFNINGKNSYNCLENRFSNTGITIYKGDILSWQQFVYNSTMNNNNLLTTIFKDNDSIYSYKNSILCQSGKSTLKSTNYNEIGIGCRITGSTKSLFYTGEICEIVLINREMSNIERSFIESSIKDRITPPINLGPNIIRRYGLCDTLLRTEKVYDSYLWSTGDTTRSISISYNDTGWYWCQVPNLYGEQMRDSIYVYKFKRKLPLDTTVCYAVPLTLNSAFSASAHYNNLWKNSNGDTLSNSSSLTLVPFSPHPLVLTVSDSLGCSISDTIRIAIDSFAFEASLGADKSLCSGDKIALESGNQKAISYLWSDNSTDSTLVVNTAGSYALRVSNARACIASDTVYAAIHGITPAVGFVADTVCFKTNSPFQDTSSSLDASNLIQWEWDFGDGNTLQQFNNSIVQHLYADSGTYLVKLRVSTDSNCANYTYKSVYVIPLPRPNFVPLQVCINEAISFSDLSQSSFGSISNYYWNFKDGNTSIDPQPVHSFTQTGTYEVSLLTITQDNCYDSIVKSVRVKPAPQAAIAVAPVCLGIPSYFSDISTNPGSNPLYQRRWYFGQNDSSTAHTASYTYASTGNHPLRLIVNSINGCSDTAEANAYVAVIPEANFKIMGLPCQHSNLSFIDSTQILPDSLEQFYWSMDGTLFSTWADATYYVFHDTLIHTLSYKVVSNYGCSDSISKSIKIHALPKVSFFADQYYGLPPLTVQFTNTTPDATAFLWNFGDGSPSSTLENPSHIYTGGLTYYPFLKAFNQYGCFSSNSDRINNYYAKIDAELSATLSEIQGDNISYSCVVVNKGVQPIKKIDFYASYQEGTELIETWSGYLEAGNSLQYTFNARSKINVMDEVHYYCIRAEVSGNQVDENASNDKLCKELQNNLWIGNPYPNPVRDVLTLDIVVVAAIEADFKFIDMQGNTLSSSSLHLSKGFNSISLPVVKAGSGSSGKLLLHIRIGEKEETRELMLVK